MKKKSRPKKENSERWLLTYSDLITLLMIFFIVMYSMSNLDKAKYDELAEAFRNSMGGGSSILTGSDGIFPNSGNTPINLDGLGTGKDAANQQGSAALTPGADTSGDYIESIRTEKDMANFEEGVKEILQEMGLGFSTETSMSGRGLAITFSNDVFFDSGKDTLKAEMKEGLSKIALLLNRVDNKIAIEGYTDNVPISSSNVFASNWQLSVARAANVAQYLEDEEDVDGERLSAVGYGEHHPVASNNTAEGRSQNRRVDIIVLYDSAEE